MLRPGLPPVKRVHFCGPGVLQVEYWTKQVPQVTSRGKLEPEVLK